MTTEVTRLADEFAKLLRRDLRPHEWAEMCAKNAAAPDAGWCASHDYLDANETMMEAFLAVTGREIHQDKEDGEVYQDPADLELWNAAWADARKRHLSGAGQ